MDKGTKRLIFFTLAVMILYAVVTTPEGRESALQNMREQNNPEYYMLQEMKRN